MTAKHDLHDDELCELLIRIMQEAKTFLESHGYRVNLVIDPTPEITDDTVQQNRA